MGGWVGGWVGGWKRSDCAGSLLTPFRWFSYGCLEEMGGWVGYVYIERVKENEAVGMRCCELGGLSGWEDGGVGGWVAYLKSFSSCSGPLFIPS